MDNSTDFKAQSTLKRSHGLVLSTTAETAATGVHLLATESRRPFNEQEISRLKVVFGGVTLSPDGKQALLNSPTDALKLFGEHSMSITYAGKPVGDLTPPPSAPAVDAQASKSRDFVADVAAGASGRGSNTFSLFTSIVGRFVPGVGYLGMGASVVQSAQEEGALGIAKSAARIAGGAPLALAETAGRTVHQAATEGVDKAAASLAVGTATGLLGGNKVIGTALQLGELGRRTVGGGDEKAATPAVSAASAASAGQTGTLPSPKTPVAPTTNIENQR